MEKSSDTFKQILNLPDINCYEYKDGNIYFNTKKMKEIVKDEVEFSVKGIKLKMNIIEEHNNKRYKIHNLGYEVSESVFNILFPFPKRLKNELLLYFPNGVHNIIYEYTSYKPKYQSQLLDKTLYLKSMLDRMDDKESTLISDELLAKYEPKFGRWSYEFYTHSEAYNNLRTMKIIKDQNLGLSLNNKAIYNKPIYKYRNERLEF